MSFPIPVRLCALVSLVGLPAVSAQDVPPQARLLQGDADSGDEFGASVALHGGLALVGAWKDDVTPFGGAGTASVFQRAGAGWVESARLLASDGRSFDGFGRSVALEGNVALIGVPGDDVYVFGLNLRLDAGSARVFRRDAAGWSEEAMLLAPSPLGADFLGLHVALSGGTAVASTRRGDATGVGVVHVFTVSGTTWSHQATLRPSDGVFEDVIGHSLAIDGDVVAVGATTGVAAGSPAGAVYVFERVGTTWTETAKLLSGVGEATDEFGYAVAVSGDTILVGAPGRDLPGTPGTSAGAVHVLVRDGASWAEQTLLVPDGAGPMDLFGGAVVLSGDTALVAARESPGNDKVLAYRFERSGSTWTQVARLVTDARSSDLALALCQSTVLVGTRWDDHCVERDGSVHVFELEGGPDHPHLAAVTPSSVPVLEPGTARTVTLTGTGLDLVTELALDCTAIDPARYVIVDSTKILVDLPQAAFFGDNWLTAGDGVYSDTIRVFIGAAAAPVLQFGPGDPLAVVDRDDGLSIVLAGQPGSVQYFFASTSDLPSTNAYGTLAIGNQFTDLFRGPRITIPASGWYEITLPPSALPDPGPDGLTIFAQTLRLRFPPPFLFSNVQSIRLVR